MFKFEMINHYELSDNDLIKICEIKKVFGKYTLNEQKEWIRNNLSKCDEHLMMFIRSELVGYLNIKKIKIQIDDLTLDAYGIGNVCVIEKANGFGSLLMKHLNATLKKQNKIGLLFCSQKMVDFYSKFDWSTINSSENLNMMVFKGDIILENNIVYKGDLF